MAFKITGLGEALKVQASQRSKQALGKKNLTLGTEYTLLFPKKNNEVIAACIVGRNCNFDLLNLSFGRIADSQMEVNAETGRIKDLSGMRQWADLSGILFKASMEKDIQAAKDEAEKIAASTGDKIDENALAQSIAKIKLAYEGQKKQGEEAAIAPTKQRLVSYSIDFSIFTEAILIPLDSALKPIYSKAVGVEVRLSITKQRELAAIQENPMYNDMDDPDGFLEVKFSYKGADTKTAGKNSYLGVEPTVRKVNLAKDADGKYVDQGTKELEYLLKDTSHDSDVIFARAGTVSFANTAADVEAAMRRYLANNRTLPLYINMEDDATKRCAKDIIALGCVFKEGTRQYQELVDMVKASEADDVVEEATMPAEATAVTNAKTVSEVVKAVEGNEELAAMVGDEINDI